MYNFFKLEFPGITTEVLRVHEVVFTQDRYSHEMVSVVIKNWGFNSDTLSTGTPVVANFTGHRTKRKFVGYVHHTKPIVSPTENFVEIVLIGASFVFKQQSQKVWANTSASSVVAEIAKKHRFSYSVVGHPRVYPQISQGGSSDWELLVRLAKQSGYALRAENTTLYFEPVTHNFTESRDNAPVYTMGSLSDPHITEVFYFKPIIGDSTPFPDAKKGAVAIHGADPYVVAPISFSDQTPVTTFRKKSGATLFDRHDTRVVAPSFSTAKFEADAAQELNRYPYRAVVEVYGDPTLKPDSPIFLRNVGKNYSGYWVILSAEHHIVNNTFTSTLEIGTDSLGFSGAWHDGKTSSYPQTSGKRTLVPGEVNAGKNDKSEVLNLGKPATTQTPKNFGLLKNQRPSKVNGQEPPVTKWVSSAGNIRPAVPVTPETTSMAIRNRVERMYANT